MTHAELMAATQSAMELAECCLAEEMVAEVECCLAEQVDDEQAVRDEFGKLYERLDRDEIDWAELRNEGDLLKARYAHTQFIQAKRCCLCGCPWND
jgi:hypothetical protein